jgi:hypothetical protein
MRAVRAGKLILLPDGQRRANSHSLLPDTRMHLSIHQTIVLECEQLLLECANQRHLLIHPQQLSAPHGRPILVTDSQRPLRGWGGDSLLLHFRLSSNQLPSQEIRNTQTPKYPKEIRNTQA